MAIDKPENIDDQASQFGSSVENSGTPRPERGLRDSTG